MQVEVKKRVVLYQGEEVYMIVANDKTAAMKEKQAHDMEH